MLLIKNTVNSSLMFCYAENTNYLTALNVGALLRILFFSLLFSTTLFSQEDCFLCIGGRDNDIIKAVFQLSDEQFEKMRNWGAELKFRNEIFELRAENLLKNHAQSSPEDIIKMSLEYKTLLDSMQGNVRLLDKRMLGIFNEEQYNLYIMLCNQVYRSPIYVERSVNEK